MKDIEMSEILGISVNTLQQWKRSNDYRYILYNYLYEQSPEKMEDWLKNFEDKQFVKFMSENDFYDEFTKNGYKKSPFQPCDSIEKYEFEKIKSKTFISKRDGQYIAILFLSRFPLKERLKELRQKIEDELNHNDTALNEIIFVTNEKKCPPKYFTELEKVINIDEKIEILSSVNVACTSIHSVGKSLFGRNVIFKDNIGPDNK